MKEIRDILALFGRAQGHSACLATVVETSGSTYRRPGARMLVLDDGRSAGSISGGCLEADVVERGRRLELGENALVTYDNRSGEDLVWGLGLGCNGVVTVLLERVDFDGLAYLAGIVERDQTVAIATAIRVTGQIGIARGTRLVVSESGWDDDSSAHRASDALSLLFESARLALQSGNSCTATHRAEGGEFTAFVDVVKPTQRLVVFGAGQDSVPLVRMAALLGWSVTLVDPRPAYATHERFPDAREHIVARPETVGARIHLGAGDAVVLMTHNYTFDLHLLGWALASDAAYVGVLGPKRRIEKLFLDLQSDGVESSRAACARVHAPIGLDIGAETPEEIALAILAEARAVLAGRRGGFLRDRCGAIHARPRTGVVVLAAGGSSRLGEPKQLMQFEGKSLLRRAVETARAAACGPVTVVLGAHAAQLVCEIDDLSVAIEVHHAWPEGLGTSISAGVRRALDDDGDLDALLLMLCDQPLVDPALLGRLDAARAEKRALISACAYSGTLGVPATFARELFDDLLALSGTRGAQSVIRRYAAGVVAIPFPDAALDVDTRSDYSALLSCGSAPPLNGL